MDDLRVPTVRISAEVLCDDGQTISGNIHIPDVASRHTGPMRAEEWLNEPAAFFPLVPPGGGRACLLNKAKVVAVSVPASTDEVAVTEEAEHLDQAVEIECQGRRFKGVLRIDMPENLRRVLDYLNRPEPFLTLREADRHYLIRKASITQVSERQEG
jgi:hypothetical protein